MSRYFRPRVVLILFASLVVAFALVVAAWGSRPSGEPESHISGTPSKTRDTNLPSATGPTTIWKNGSSKIFGNLNDLINETAIIQASQVAAMKEIGISSVRIDARWSLVQPTSPETFDWAQLDQEVDSIRHAGMSVDLIIDGCPRWAAVAGAVDDPSPQPASPTQYAVWAADVAARYAPMGVSDFEIWNEPNAANAWQPKANPAAYTADLVSAYSAIKAVDPSAFIISGGLAPEATDGTNYSPVDFLKAMYADGAKGSFDALGYHPYGFPALPDSYEPWSAWSTELPDEPFNT